MIRQASHTTHIKCMWNDLHASTGDEDFDGSTKTITRPENKVTKPPMYRVLLMNDDFTPMDFVTHILQKFFKKNLAEATDIMLQVHQKGSGLAGVYSYEMAETKVYLVNQYAKDHKYPLQCNMEKDEC